jgi:opacity protein-like surface antigen
MNIRSQFAGSLAAAGLILAAAGAARAQEGSIPRFAMAVDVGAVSVQERGFGAGRRFAGGVFFRTGHRMGIEVQLENFAVPVAEGTAELGAGRMSMTTLLVNEELYLMTRGRFLPYGMAGIGFTFIGYAPDTPQPVERGFVDRLALQLGAGADVKVSRGLALGLRVRYNLVKTWVEPLPREGRIRDRDPLAQNMLHLYGLELGLGIKISL